MSHPLEQWITPLQVRYATTTPRASGNLMRLDWELTLANMSGEECTVNGSVRHVPTSEKQWSQFWGSVAEQTEWERLVLLAHDLLHRIENGLRPSTYRYLMNYLAQRQGTRDWDYECVQFLESLGADAEGIIGANFNALQHVCRDWLMLHPLAP